MPRSEAVELVVSLNTFCPFKEKKKWACFVQQWKAAQHFLPCCSLSSSFTSCHLWWTHMPNRPMLHLLIVFAIPICPALLFFLTTYNLLFEYIQLKVRKRKKIFCAPLSRRRRRQQQQRLPSTKTQSQCGCLVYLSVCVSMHAFLFRSHPSLCGNG